MCCRYTTTPKCRPGVCVSIVCGPCDCSSVSVVALRVELSATRLSAGFGQPALDYHVPTSLSTKSGWRDSNPRSRAPNDHAAHGARRAAAALHPVMQSAAADSNRGHRRAAVVLLAPAPAARVPGRDTQASLRSVSSSCGSRTRVRALKGRDPLPIDERAISARTVHAVDTLGQRAPFTQWVGRCSNPGHRRAAVVALVFSQVLHHLSYRPNEKSLMSL